MEDVFAILDPPKPPPVVPATVRAGWTMPTATCDGCGATCGPVIYQDVDSVGATLDCEAEGCFVDFSVDVAWPFVENKASVRDFERLGFRWV